MKAWGMEKVLSSSDVIGIKSLPRRNERTRCDDAYLSDV